MSLTNIGIQKTPGRPIEIVFAPNAALPNPNQTLLLFGHMGPTGGPSGGGSASGTATPYVAVTINNVSDPVAASTEVVTKFGNGSELAKMVLAAVNANSGGSTFPAIQCVPLAQSDVDYGQGTNKALTVALNLQADFRVGCYDANSSTLRSALSSHCQTVSGATRTDNQQFGSTGVLANFSVTDPSTLPVVDTQYLTLITLRDTSGNPYSVGELASAAAALMASNAVPFNPLDGVVLNGVSAPALQTDWYSVGAGLESETALGKGWTPLRVFANGTVAFVRTVTTRLTSNGVTPVSAYYDVQDFQVLYYWRKTLWTRFGQPDFSNVKASQQKAQALKAEMIRLANAFQDQGMFQAVQQLASQFVVQRNTSDRSRFDAFTPVNVVPGLHVIATQVSAGVQFDTFTV